MYQNLPVACILGRDLQSVVNAKTIFDSNDKVRLILKNVTSLIKKFVQKH